MFRRNKKSRKYQAPGAVVTHIALERNFCGGPSVRFQVKVQDLDNINAAPESERAAEYFEDIIS